MPLALLAFIAGILTILAPCVLPILPVVIGRSSAGFDVFKPYRVLLGLGASIFIFSILLKSLTIFLPIPPQVWQIVSGSVIIVFGLVYLFPKVWEEISNRIPFFASSQQNLSAATEKKGFWSDILVGSALGPVFAGCSPTYALIVATILPVDIVTGTLYLLIYIAGLILGLLPIVLFGRIVVRKLSGAARPDSIFKKILGVVFILIGLAIMFSFDKYLETQILQAGGVDWIIEFENETLREFR